MQERILKQFNKDSSPKMQEDDGVSHLPLELVLRLTVLILSPSVIPLHTWVKTCKKSNKLASCTVVSGENIYLFFPSVIERYTAFRYL